MDLLTRFLAPTDAQALHDLYRSIASHPGGFARDEEEVNLPYIEKMLRRCLSGGVAIGAVDRESGALIGFIVASRPGPKVFDHVLSDLTIGVQPGFQRRGVGRRLLLDFLEHVQGARSDVMRVELIVRESNHRAIAFYESIGFRREGVFEKRIRTVSGEFEADIPMGWLKNGI